MLAQLAWLAYYPVSTKSQLASAELISLPFRHPPDYSGSSEPIKLFIMANQWQLGRSIKIELDHDDKLCYGLVAQHVFSREDVLGLLWRSDCTSSSADEYCDLPKSSFSQPDDKRVIDADCWRSLRKMAFYHLGGTRYVPKSRSSSPLETLPSDIDNLKKNAAK